jgi:hypothetical protein
LGSERLDRTPNDEIECDAVAAGRTMSHFWHEFLRDLQAILPLIISVAVVLISWLQWRTAKGQWETAVIQSETAKKQWETAEKQAETARNRLRIDLFERRITVCDALMTLAAIAVAEGDVNPEQRRTCAIATKGAEFLFNEEIDNYCLQLVREAVTLGLEKYRIDQMKNVAAKQNSQAEASYSDRLLWFNTQIDEMPKRFAEFLKVEG